MSLSRKFRWSLYALFCALGIFFAPLAFFMASNLGAAILDLALNRKPIANEITGDYKLDVPWGKSRLHIDPDGTFKEAIAANGQPSRTVLGKWQLGENGDNFVELNFHPFGMVWDDDHDRETNLYGINFYKPHFGDTYGMINDDLDEKFVRQQGDPNGK